MATTEPTIQELRFAFDVIDQLGKIHGYQPNLLNTLRDLALAIVERERAS